MSCGELNTTVFDLRRSRGEPSRVKLRLPYLRRHYRLHSMSVKKFQQNPRLDSILHSFCVSPLSLFLSLKEKWSVDTHYGTELREEEEEDSDALSDSDTCECLISVSVCLCILPVAMITTFGDLIL